MTCPAMNFMGMHPKSHLGWSYHQDPLTKDIYEMCAFYPMETCRGKYIVPLTDKNCAASLALYGCACGKVHVAQYCWVGFKCDFEMVPAVPQYITNHFRPSYGA